MGGVLRATLMVLVIYGTGFLHAGLASTESDLVDAHNSARSAVNVPPLVWSTQVASYAQNWASTLQASCQMVHSKGPYGENLYMWRGSDGLVAPPATDAVKEWVKEKADYNYASNTCAPGKVCGHYTQVVWRNSVRVGCARVKCNGANAYIVSCNYDPPGNVGGQKPY
ncbi:pathogenesis-related protein 1C-like [Selaginella moellendorffii]|uniref:pathogenesis-related protein 1C-like n=1 Tax=Selaginella moellendorffii TaxID=88036 RepID=UPI000D1C7BC2|nr:pathogenesis-related protein 1C-like [Selaginella moellendorffii]|eukprot:XP_024541000.1 pathogenesis-related protein 1C-like [Selaginella moellendorffii]